jgi:FkbM family methyltransferase
MTISTKLSFPLHVSKPFLRPTAGEAGRSVASAHLRIAREASRSDPHDYAVKRTEFLGLQVSFFHWPNLHFLFDEIFVDRCYAFEPENDSPRIIDAGGNIGMATMWFLKAFPRATITTIEPDPATFELLQVNVTDNRLHSVTPIQAALSDSTGDIEFMTQPAQPGDLRMSIDPARMAGTSITVPSVRLSDLVDGPIDLLKLDVEGAEHEVMEEMASSGALSEIKAISLEYHHHIDPHVDRLSELLSLLEQNHFTYHISASPLQGALSWPAASTFQNIAVLAVRPSASGSSRR